ncbi:hypothetical protein PIB30_017250 [Stylosanthes scabra]|uniref:Bet v I/Major latex protein domain-containing protein n=1 Tax=Stylosanthes scabra TaxID=79078 RepID=A0ABU6Q8G0_9FABA|nr:hypothetical protein [Stylosanthes scabra]
MDLSGKFTIEVGIQVPAAKFFDVLTKQLHIAKSICGRVQDAKLHEGDEWHSNDSVKQWTSVVGGTITKALFSQDKFSTNPNQSVIIFIVALLCNNFYLCG